MNRSRIIVLGIAVVAAVGAGYLAKNMAAPKPAVVEARPVEPAVSVTEVLVVGQDVPIGESLGGNVRWQAWPSDSINDTFITRDGEPDAARWRAHLRPSLLCVPLQHQS